MAISHVLREKKVYVAVAPPLKHDRPKEHTETKKEGVRNADEETTNQNSAAKAVTVGPQTPFAGPQERADGKAGGGAG